MISGIWFAKWWKWLCVLLLLYVVIGGFFVPLGPGVTNVQPVFFKPDSVYTFQIKSYHAHLQSPNAGNVQLWFKNQNKYFKPLSLKVLSNELVVAQFAVSSLQQDSIRPGNFDVVINNDIDGTFALRDAITLIKTDAIDSAKLNLTAFASEPEVKTNKHNLFRFPYREILYETIRNTFFHVPMWFVMTILVFVSMAASIIYLVKGDLTWDALAHQSVIAAMLFGVCGYLTGLVWAKYTWYIGVSWGDVLRKLLLEDVKMAAALVSILFYLAYLVLRRAISDAERSSKIGALYNIVAFVVFILCVFVLPRLTDSMHPGNGGNPAFSKYDLDSTLRMFFYPAVIGWILFGFWILSVLLRLRTLELQRETVSS